MTPTAYYLIRPIRHTGTIAFRTEEDARNYTHHNGGLITEQWINQQGERQL